MKTWRLLLSLLLILSCSLAIVQAGDDTLAFAVTWSPDGRWIAANTTQGLWLFDAEDLEAEPFVYFEGEISTVEFDTTGAYLAVAKGFTDEGNVSILELATGEVVQELHPEKSPEDSSVIYDMLYSSDGKYLLVGNTGELSFYAAETGELLRVVSMYFEGNYGYSHWITSITEIGNGYFAVSNWNNDLTLLTREGNIRASYQMAHFALPETLQDALVNVDDSIFFGVEYLDANRYLVHASKGIFVVDTEDEVVELRLPTLEGESTDGYAYSGVTEMLVAGTLGMWQAVDVAANEVVLDVRLENEAARVFSFDFNPDGSRFVSLQTDGLVTIWDTATGEVLMPLGDFARAVGYKWG